MILNTFLKKNNFILNTNQKMALGRRIASCYRSIYNNELKRVTISENGIKMEVIDYPREFFESNKFKIVLNRYARERKIKVNGKLIQLNF
jgi:hypothetical protein